MYNNNKFKKEAIKLNSITEVKSRIIAFKCQIEINPSQIAKLSNGSTSIKSD